jgi:hypothetical protein
MFIRILKFASAASVALALSTAAGAATIFNFTFSAPWALSFTSATATGSGQLYANEQSDGSYQVYDVIGTSRVTGSATVGTLDTVSAIGLSTPTITGSAATGFSINAIQLSGAETYTFTRNIFGQNYTVGSGLRASGSGTFTLALVPQTSPVPDVATWVLMVIGFGAVGAMLRSGKRRSDGVRT